MHKVQLHRSSQQLINKKKETNFWLKNELINTQLDSYIK